MDHHKHTFARFWKCALHVNTATYRIQYQGSKQSIDETSYAEDLLQSCLDNRIDVIGLADHGDVKASKTVRTVLSEAGIVVFPGFEIATTEKVHWICLFSENESEEVLQRILGKLDLTDPSERVRPSRLGGLQLLEKVEALGGFCMAAHITSKSGILKHKLNNLWIDDRLRAAQIPGSPDDLPLKYKRVIRNQDPAYKRSKPIALVTARDVVEPSDLDDSHTTCLVKMTQPQFSSFMLAFRDPESRVRTLDEPKELTYSVIDSVAIEGGFFGNLRADMSAHLNAVIGGRGTGKSTFLECIRYALDVPHKGPEAQKQGRQIVSENLGRFGGRVIVNLRSATNHMQPYTVIRRFGDPPRVIDEHENESLLHPWNDLLPAVEIFGQNEIHELARNPDQLARVLDRFLPEISGQQKQLDSAYRKLRDNSERLLKTHERRDEIALEIAELPILEERVRKFQEQDMIERLRRVPLLARERQLMSRIRSEVKRLREGVEQFKDSIPDLVFLSDKALDGLPHADSLRHGRKVLKGLNTVVRRRIQEIDDSVTSAETPIDSLLEGLERKLVTDEARLEREFANLPDIAGKSGSDVGRTYQRLVRDIERIRPQEKKRDTLDAAIRESEQERRDLLGDISDLRSARTRAKETVSKRLNKRLKGKMRITIVPDGIRQPLRDFLQNLPGIGQRRTEWVDGAEGLTVFGLIAAMRAGKDALLGQGWGLADGLAQTLSQLPLEQILALEAIDTEDRVSIELNISHEGELYRSLDRLSTGQQCTAILHLLLLDNQDPLIMDQPEDNLDNAFIAERIVRELRVAKTERQFLFATHNANIPVFGDAEWIGVCSATDDSAELSKGAQGSIDIPEIRDRVTSILEGGREAFVQRKEKYGLDY